MEEELALLALFAVLCWLVLKPRNRPQRRGAKTGKPYLDRVLLRVSGVEVSARQLCQNVLGLGATGSGKTSGVLNALLRGLLGEGRAGLLFLVAKSEDRDNFLSLVRKAGRLGDVIEIDSTAKQRLNFFDSLLRLKADPATLALLASSGFDQFHEVSGRNSAQGFGSDGRFWAEAYQRMVRSVILLLLLAGERVTPGNILRVILSIPASPAQIADQGWKDTSFCNRCLRAAWKVKGQWLAEFEAVSSYVLDEIPGMSDRTRSGVVAMVTGTADILTKGLGAKLLATDSTFQLSEAMAGNKIVIVNLPYGEWQEVGRFVATGMKYLAQIEWLRRKVTDDTRIFAIVSDEYQNVATEFDWQHVSTCRSYRVPMVVMTQGIESLHSLFGGENGKSKVDALVGNMGTTFVTLPTPSTAAWVIERLGRVKRRLYGGSSSTGGYTSPMDFLNPPPSQASGSFSETYETALHHSDLQRMATGGPEFGFKVDALMLQPGGRTPYWFVVFNQRG